MRIKLYYRTISHHNKCFGTKEIKKKTRQTAANKINTSSTANDKKEGKKKELGIDPQDMYRPPPISQSINDPYNLYSSLHESKSNNEEREGEKRNIK